MLPATMTACPAPMMTRHRIDPAAYDITSSMMVSPSFIYPKKLSHIRNIDISAAATKIAAMVEVRGSELESAKSTASVPAMDPTASNMRLPAMVAILTEKRIVGISKTERASNSAISKGILPKQTSEPRRGDGVIPTRNSHAQKKPNPRKRAGKRLLPSRFTDIPLFSFESLSVADYTAMLLGFSLKECEYCFYLL